MKKLTTLNLTKLKNLANATEPKGGSEPPGPRCSAWCGPEVRPDRAA